MVTSLAGSSWRSHLGVVTSVGHLGGVQPITAQLALVINRGDELA